MGLRRSVWDGSSEGWGVEISLSAIRSGRDDIDVADFGGRLSAGEGRVHG